MRILVPWKNVYIWHKAVSRCLAFVLTLTPTVKLHCLPEMFTWIPDSLHAKRLKSTVFQIVFCEQCLLLIIWYPGLSLYCKIKWRQLFWLFRFTSCKTWMWNKSNLIWVYWEFQFQISSTKSGTPFVSHDASNIIRNQSSLLPYRCLWHLILKVAGPKLNFEIMVSVEFRSKNNNAILILLDNNMTKIFEDINRIIKCGTL